MNPESVYVSGQPQLSDQAQSLQFPITYETKKGSYNNWVIFLLVLMVFFAASSFAYQAWWSGGLFTLLFLMELYGWYSHIPLRFKIEQDRVAIVLAHSKSEVVIFFPSIVSTGLASGCCTFGQMFVTNTDYMGVIYLDRGFCGSNRIFLSPENPAQFVNDLNFARAHNSPLQQPAQAIIHTDQGSFVVMPVGANAAPGVVMGNQPPPNYTPYQQSAAPYPAPQPQPHPQSQPQPGYPAYQSNQSYPPPSYGAYSESSQPTQPTQNHNAPSYPS
eukprot:GCRY01001891.1.p1 GENE.GCRY01001891.1~~GCRY01001891.1.p1  ORF type:complete len:313 (+),score=20.24 GCRY01001891.1:122-940(+)